MAFSLVQGTNLDGAAATSFNLTALTVTAGNSLMLQLRAGGTSQTITISDNKGNTWSNATPDVAPVWIASFGAIAAFSAHNIAGGSTTVTVTYGTSATTARIELKEYNPGTGFVGAFDAGVQNNANSTNLDSTNATPSTTTSVAIGFGGNNTAQTFTVGTGYGHLDQIPAAPNARAAFEDQLLTTTTALNATMTMGGANQWAMLIAIYKAVATAASFIPGPPIAQLPGQNYPVQHPAARNVLPSGTAPQIIVSPLLTWRRDTYWDSREYWVRPPNVLPQGVVGTPLPQPPNQQAAYRRDPYWAPRDYSAPLPNLLAQGTAPQIVIGPSQQPAAYRRDPYWNNREYWTQPPTILPQGTAPQIIVGPVDTPSAQRRDSYWSNRDYWTQPPTVLPQGTAPQIPYATLFDAAYRRDSVAPQLTPSFVVPQPVAFIPQSLVAQLITQGWRPDQFQWLLRNVQASGVSQAFPFLAMLDPAYRRDGWGLNVYQVQSPGTIQQPVVVQATIHEIGLGLSLMRLGGKL